MSDAYLRTANKEDMDLLYVWANDKEVRNNAFHMDSIDYDVHKEWFKRMLANNEILLFIYLYNAMPIGQVRLDVMGETATISYSVECNYRGQGHGKKLLHLVELEVVRHPNIKTLKARVKNENVASQLVFEKLNYTKQQQAGFMEYSKRLTEERASALNKMEINGHGGGVLLLTNNRNSLELYEYLSEMEKETSLYSGCICLEQIRNRNPRFIVSYNYNHVIRQDVIDFMKGNVVNLHASLLPWNRGSSPNFWSFVDDTPKGVTIHAVDEGLDTGPILVQKELYFDEDAETFRSSYDKLNSELKELFKKNWEAIKTGTLPRKTQNLSGSRHDLKDLKEMDARYGIDWNERIVDFKRRLKRGG